MKLGTARRSILVFAALSFIVFASMTPSAQATTNNVAPNQGMAAGFWSSGVKQMFGTAYEAYDSAGQYSDNSPTAPISHVWYTGAQGILTEVYWPTVDEAQIRDSQILVTDGSSFFFEERKDSVTTVNWVQNGVPMYQVINRDPQGRFEIQRTLFSDPDRDVVLQKIQITSHVAGLQFFLLHKPMVSNTPLGDNALASLGDVGPGAGLFAWQQDEAQALIPSIPLKQVTAGYAGSASDGWEELSQTYKLSTNYNWAYDGNVVLTGQLDIPAEPGTVEFDIALAFGPSVNAAYQLAWQSLNGGTDHAATKFINQWQSYQASIKDLSGASNDDGVLFRSSVATVKSMEDKTHSGAFIASPTIPWGLDQTDWNDGYFSGTEKQKMVSGYHIVWPRDLYQMATSFMAIGDMTTALASLNYLKTIQYDSSAGTWTFGSHQHDKNGSFPQNCWIDGTNQWGGLQLDEVSMPIVLAYRLWKAGAIKISDYWDMVQRAADFISDMGPWTPEERWEEIYGVSPSTTAAEIAALWSASEIAKSVGDTTRSTNYQNTANSWNANLEKWVFTTSGGEGNGNYFIRIAGAGSYDEAWDPNANFTFQMANNAGQWLEKDVLDGGFLELVRFGIRSALSQSIVATIPNYESTIKVDFPGIGPSFRRYLGDKYGYNEATGAQTMGMPWPILTGERGHYALALAKEQGLKPFEIDNAVDPYISAVEGFATPSHFIPEQVWDQTGDMGKPTGAATPLGWAHGEYIKLLRSRLDRKVFDTESLGFQQETEKK